MAKQKGLIRVKGSIGDVTYYKSQDGWLARERVVFDAQRMAKSPSYKRVRENMAEFSTSATSGKLLRESIAPLLQHGSDGRMVSRVTKLMMLIKNLNVSATRGHRTVAGGMSDPEAYAILKGFNFNKDAILTAILRRPYAIDTATGEITIPELIPEENIVAPFEATHVVFQGCWARVDFGTGLFETYYSPETVLPLDTTPVDVLLTPTAEPTGTGTDLFLLKVAFKTQMGTQLYPLLNGSCNALSLIDLV